VQRLAYDAHGKRRNPNWTDPIGPIASLTPRGFTGHEMDDEYGLINMNAREYDPVIGRFLSADTIVGAGFGQGLNRYSYVRNNPLSYTDPTGMFSLKNFVEVVSFQSGVGVLIYANDHKDDIARAATKILGQAGRNKYLGGLVQLWLLTSDFGYIYGWSTGDWKSVGRAHATGAVIAASFGAGAAAWTAYAAASGLAAAGIFVVESAAIGYASSYATARINGASNDEARHAALLSAKRAAVSAGARVAYNGLVKYDVTPEPGGDAVEKGRNQMPVQGANNVGSQGKPLDPNGWFNEGGIVSRAANQIPGVNAVGGLHDVMQINLGSFLRDYVLNIPNMIPAAVITYAALLNGGLGDAIQGGRIFREDNDQFLE